MGPARQAAKKRGEERRERGRREQTVRSAGRQRDEGSLCFSSPPGIVIFSNFVALHQSGGVKVLLDARHWEEGHCVTTAGCVVEEEEEEVSHTAIPSERLHQNTPSHPSCHHLKAPPLPLIHPPPLVRRPSVRL